MSAKNSAAIKSAADMHVVGCPLADAVVARIDSMRRRVAMFFKDDSGGASTGNGRSPSSNEQRAMCNEQRAMSGNTKVYQ
jgi:hypothetical protein